MFRSPLYLIIAIAASLILPNHAMAQLSSIKELHFGVSAHNVCMIDCKNANIEDGINLHIEMVWPSPEFLGWAMKPKPVGIASINSAGDTSFIGLGLNWDIALGKNWSLNSGFGYIVHNGAIKNPFRSGDPNAISFSEAQILFGSKDLFRSNLGLSYHLNHDWRIEIFVEHLSHGQILGNGRNQGLNNAGLKWVRAF